MTEEWVDIVDAEDRVIGRATRRQMRTQNLRHRTIAVLVANTSGAMYVHRRTELKDIFPGMYDVFVGGVVSAGEDYADCAVRELAEELGIKGPKPQQLFMFRYDGAQTRSHTAVFRVTWDGAIRHQASEVAWGGYLSTPEILENSKTWSFVPDGWAMFRRYLESPG